MARDTAKTGTVIGRRNGNLLIEFPIERCSDCHCAAGLTGRATVVALDPCSIADPIAVRTDANGLLCAPGTTDALTIGQQVELRMSARRLVRISATLFGLPLVLALLGCFAASQIHSDVLTASTLQASGAFGGFGLGAVIGYMLREQLQTGIYQRLAVHPIDC